ncbi:peptide/nickel transport system substrate-binding protein [Allocatelliglobosispora scoriae]|uniref:Peptide/nickel transport system substrate-binding protein n=1 Tax=Allocatelliglobosispora scoriae TaxID=643052 RepID=A0A841C4F2_9ACTN|nr:ABC transporter substrate-binding protein [Allocatelliglobosispora scoriae]MBB5873701.1 peptide/nickel transport system substrate-binding protein [Allocatelliglobosispora scoriae]
MRRRHSLSGALALTVLLGLTACNANAAPEQQPPGGSTTVKGGTLTILSSSTTVNLDPAKSQSLAITTLGLVHRRLTSWDIQPGKTAAVVPDLATDAGKPTDGGRTWTYTLREGLKYADGTAITAADVKYGVERSFAPELSGGLGYHKTLLTGGAAYKGPFGGGALASIEAPDARTIVFRLDKPFGDWPWVVSTPAFAPVPKAKEDVQKYGQNPAASGPYQVESYQQGTALKLKRNSYWDAATDPVRTGGPENIVIQLGQDTSVVAQRLIASTGDDRNAFGSSFVPPAQLAQIQSQPDARKRLVTSEAGALEFLALNTRRPALADVRVRQAIRYAVDKKAYQIAAGGEIGGGPATTLITPGIPGRQDYDPYPAGASGDVDKAKQLLAAAGVTALSLTLLVTNDPVRLTKAQAIQQGLTRIGVTVTIKPEDSDTWFSHVTDDLGDYDLALTSWQPDFPSANANIQPLFASSEIGGGGFNLSRYSNAAVDKLIEQASAEIDQTRAQALWVDADKLIQADSPVVPLIYSRNSFLHGSNVANFFIAAFPAYPNYLKVSLNQV